MSKITKLLDSVRDSDAFQELKVRYDELDAQTKFYVNSGALAAGVLIIFVSILTGVSRVASLKRDINEKEELIGYLQRSADQIKTLKAQQQAKSGNADTSLPMSNFIENILLNTGIDRAKADLSEEKPGVEDKDSKEFLTNMKLNQINLKQLTKLLFNMIERGSGRALNVRDLVIETKPDGSGYIDATVTLATYKAK